jgi:hypothetical protein
MTTATRPPGSTRSTKTSSRRDASARRPSPKPFTVDHYRQYARLSVLDDGEQFEPEDFQLLLVEDLFAGFQQNWWILPEGSGKTTKLGHLALYFGDYTSSAMIPIAASSREQAEIMYRQAEGFVYRTPGLRDRFKCQEGYRRIKCLRTGGRIQVYAADDRTGDGIIPLGIALVDELHRHRSLRLYRTWVGKLIKTGAQLVTISTAGEPGSEFEETRARIRTAAAEVTVHGEHGCHVRAAGEGIVLHDFRVPSRKQAEDMEVVAEANPRRAMTAEVLRQKRDSPTMTLEHWLRFVCNIATRADGSPITPEEWDPLRIDEPVDVSLPAFGWLDLGWKIDTSALGVLLWESDERRIVAGVKVIEPPVDEGQVVAGLLRLQGRFRGLAGVVYDPNAGGQQMAQLLSKGTHPLQTDDAERAKYGLEPLRGRVLAPLEFIEHSQDNAPMALAAVRLDEAIRGSEVRDPSLRWVAEGDWEALRRHALNAARKSLGGEKWKYDRPADAQGAKRKDYPIDALTGLLMGHSVAVAEAEKPAPDNSFAFL